MQNSLEIESISSNFLLKSPHQYFRRPVITYVTWYFLLVNCYVVTISYGIYMLYVGFMLFVFLF